MKRSSPWPLVGIAAFTVLALLGALLVKLSHDDGPSARELLDGAPAAVDASRSAHIAMSVKVDTNTVDTTVEGAGAVDFSNGSGWFTIDALGQHIEVRTDAKTLYVLPSGAKTWLAAKVDDASALGSFGTGPDAAIAFVDLLRGDAEVKDLGTEKVGGADARHVRATIDVDTAIAKAGVGGKAGLQALADLAAKKGSLPIDVWIDDAGLPVRQRLSGLLQGFKVVITLDLDKFGSKLGVAIPPEGEVRDVEGDELAQVFGKPSK